jgi:tetratricopeptide (TPR) repeat protein
MREALDALVKAWQRDPACDPALLHTIAQTAVIARDWVLVDESTHLLLARNADDANALVWRAACVQHRNHFDEAERLLREAARVVSDNPVVLHKLALCVKEQARFAEAETLLERALELTPDNAHALFDLSELEIRSGRYAPRLDALRGPHRVRRRRQRGRPPLPRSARTGRVNRWQAKRSWSTASRATAIVCGQRVFCRFSLSARPGRVVA